MCDTVPCVRCCDLAFKGVSNVQASKEVVGNSFIRAVFRGKVSVEGLDTLRFVPGAIADHQTSAGDMLTDSSQMSALRWLEAGPTGSYGTVVEPCNLPQKFPDPVVVSEAYLRGETLIEA